MSEKLIILLLSGTLLMTGGMALSWEPGRDRTLTLGLVLVAMLCIGPAAAPADAAEQGVKCGFRRSSVSGS